jgi:hypothetical protein
LNYRHLLTAVGAVLLLSASEAQATAILTLGNVPQPDENVLLNTGLTGNPIFGTTNQTGLAVRFTGVETLTAPANGQARIDASDDFFTYLMIDVPNGTFESLIVNPDATADGTIDFRVTTNTGVQLFNDVVLVGNGNNFFTITTDAAQSLVSVEYLADVDLADTSQVRLGGAQLVSVPDPASTFSLLGFGLVGLAAARRRFARK